MNLTEHIHGRYVHNRRVHVLSQHLATLLPQHARVLDVGCGDGLLAYLISQLRPDIDLQGVDVIVRPQTHVPVETFDGRVLPFADGSFDVVMLVDVLHHLEDPMVILREAVRVASQAVVIKDHTRNGLFAGLTLRFMDQIGNKRHGVILSYTYWPRQRWCEAFKALDVKVGVRLSKLGLYPRPAGWVFDRSLHFITRLDVN